MNDPPRAPQPPPGEPPPGLCATCAFTRIVESDRGSMFRFCERSRTDARFPRYPALPVLACAGWTRAAADERPCGSRTGS
ncbi:MAG TPA: hypothetical protein VFX12_07000 [Vicinamibacterales bacterium]|nr:hypothetical protein [Vicinamibacterales bacterium]